MTRTASEQTCASLKIKLSNLANKVAVSSPSRELDAEIYCAWFKSAYADETHEQHYQHALQNGPKFTSSIDAAMQLVEDDHEFEIISAKLINEYIAILTWGDSQVRAIQCRTPAIALTVAALRARAMRK